MKYLKRNPLIKENLIFDRLDRKMNDLNNVKSFCDGYLANLYDDDFVSLVVPQFDRYDIWLEKSDESVFYFSDIENTYVPFIKMLASEYKLHADRDKDDDNEDLKSIMVNYAGAMASLPYKPTIFSVNNIETISNTGLKYIIISILNEKNVIYTT